MHDERNCAEAEASCYPFTGHRGKPRCESCEAKKGRRANPVDREAWNNDGSKSLEKDVFC